MEVWSKNLMQQRQVGLEQGFKTNGNRSYKEVVVADELPDERGYVAMEIR